eukprot:Skav234956  [mRNA]  locus=scaffold2817:356457:363152:- [translate_table: standard]
MVLGRAFPCLAAVRLAANRSQHMWSNLHGVRRESPCSTPILILHGIRQMSSVMRPPSQMEIQSKKLTRRLKDAPSATQFFSCLEETLNGELFNDFQASVAYHSLATWTRRGHLHGSAEEIPVILQLNDRFKAMLANNQVRPRALANAIWGVAHMFKTVPSSLDVVPAMITSVQLLASKMDAQQTANILWAAATLQVAAPEISKMVPALVTRVPAVVREMNEQHVSNSLWAAASLKEDAPEVLKVVPFLLNQIPAIIKTMKPVGLSQCLTAFVQLKGFVPQVDFFLQMRGSENGNLAVMMVEAFNALRPEMRSGDLRRNAKVVAHACKKLGLGKEMVTSELLSCLGPLAAVNFSHRIAALGALERGDAARAALKAYCQEDVHGRGYLGPAGVRAFVASVFQGQGLTPPMEARDGDQVASAHVSVFFRLFSASEDHPLGARGCLWGELVREPVAATVAAPLKCHMCGAEVEEDSLFCTACGARLHVTPAPATSDVNATVGVPVVPSTHSSQGAYGSPSQATRMCQANMAPVPAPPSSGMQAPRPLMGPKCLDPSRVRTCRPVSAEMGHRMQAPCTVPVQTPLMAPVTAGVPPAVQLSVPYVRKRSLDSGEEVPLRSSEEVPLRIGSDELRPPDELPEREAAAVRVALERWRELRWGR